MTQSSCIILFKLKKPILFNEFGGICSRLDRDLMTI
jgi:hypothetical protein